MSNSVPLKGQSDKSIGAGFAPLSVQAQSLPNLTVAIRAGSFWNSLGQVVEYPGGNSPTIPAPTILNRWSLVSLSDTGSVVITHGTTAAAPAIPAPPPNTLPIAAIYMTPTTTAITSERVMDVRPFVNVANVVPNLAAELADRPTIATVNAQLALKADIDGTPSDSFTLNSDAMVGTDAALYVERGSLPNTGIRWNEALDRWEFTNDGGTWLEIASVSGSFMPIVSGATAGHVATLNSLGEVVDSGTALTALATDIELATKADKVVGAVVNNLAGLTAAGNLTDSGVAPSSFALATHAHVISDVTGLPAILAGKADLTGSTFTGNVVVDTTTAPALTVGEISGTDVGLRVDRVTPDPDAIMYWDEASDSWVAGVVGNVGTILTAANVVLSVNSVLPVLGDVTLTPADIGAQPADPDLTAVAAIGAGDGFVQRTSGVWSAAALTGSQVNVALGYAAADAAALTTHIANTALHLTPTQNTFLDAVTVTAAEVNELAGVTTAVLETADIGVTVASQTHTHVAADVTDFDTAADARVAAAVGVTVAAFAHTHDAADITSGTFADARIAATNVTQHQTVIDHDVLLNYNINEHIDHTAVTLTAGIGLDGGGDISGNRTFDVAALKGTTTFDFGSIAANTTAETTITVTGAAVGDPVAVTVEALETGLVMSAFVSATDTVTVRLGNVTTGAIDPVSHTFQVIVFDYTAF